MTVQLKVCYPYLAQVQIWPPRDRLDSWPDPPYQWIYGEYLKKKEKYGESFLAPVILFFFLTFGAEKTKAQITINYYE